MLDGKAYRAHFPDDPAYELPPGVPRQLNSAALMEALAALEGGNAAWLATGYELTADDGRMADEAVDAWLKPYERPHDKAAAMREYLSWEIDLPARMARDGSANFIEFRP